MIQQKYKILYSPLERVMLFDEEQAKAYALAYDNNAKHNTLPKLDRDQARCRRVAQDILDGKYKSLQLITKQQVANPRRW